MEVLIKSEYGDPEFMIDFLNEEGDCYSLFVVFKVLGTVNGINSIELYLGGRIKWDGCSDIEFGDSGGIHFCDGFDEIKRVLDEVWEVVPTRLDTFEG